MIQSKDSEWSRRRKAEGERISKIVNDVIESDETKWEYVTGGTDRTALHIPINEIIVSGRWSYLKKGTPQTGRNEISGVSTRTDDYYYCTHRFYSNDTGHWVVYYDIYRYERFVRGIDGGCRTLIYK